MPPPSHFHRAGEHGRAIADQDVEERKARLQTHGRSSVTRSIAHAIVLKDRDLFFLSDPDGSVPMDGMHGCGLYYHDCRFLNGYEMRLGNASPSMLACTVASGFKSVIELTNPDLKTERGLVRKETIGITWKRILDDESRSVAEILTVHNYAFEPVDFPLELTFRSEFEPLFAVRGLLGMKLGKLRPSSWEDGMLKLAYDGADKILRGLSIRFAPAPQSTGRERACFHLHLESGEKTEIRVWLGLTESKPEDSALPRAPEQIRFDQAEKRLQRASDDCLGNATEIDTDSPLLHKVMARSMRDLHMLKSRLDGREFYAAGVPWFVALFGRDSLITALETLAYDPRMAEDTLRLMAKFQGRKIDEWRDGEPGKIMHELRIGELAHLNEIPQTPYYGTVDATPLFLILLARHAAWTGNLRVFDDLRAAVEGALSWIDGRMENNRGGYLEYASSSKKGLINQGWKDSGDAIVNADGRLAEPPISLVEVQGYVYLAKISLAELYERAGEPERARRLREQAAGLRARFNREFWLEDLGFYALALQAGNVPVEVISSNPGQALWTGIVDADKAGPTTERLMAETMFSGWGVRTLAAGERRYNPVGYHLGTVWPHDNAIIAAGLRRYGFDRQACRIFGSILEAAQYFEHERLPEVFSGFSRASYGTPVRYPVACHPQAWAAGTVPYFVETALGLQPDAFEHRLRIVKPVLPDFVGRLEMRRLRIGNGRADLRFQRNAKGAVRVTVLNVEGHLEVVTEDQSESAQNDLGGGA